MRRKAAPILLALTATLALTAPAVAVPEGTPLPSVGSSPVTPQPGFRVLPYLQSPSSDSMTVVWISETDTPGTLTVTGPEVEQELTSQPRKLGLLEYSDAELSQEIAGLEQGSWLRSDSNYQHIVTINGLAAGASYEYTVAQDDATHSAEFATAPDPESWTHIRMAAFSDTETEPKGRVEHREWESAAAGPAPGSVPRPGPGSAWAERYGTARRYGQELVRYPMNQADALDANLATIAEADPDLLLIAGDLTQGSGYQPAWDEFWRHFAGESSDFASHVPLVTALGNWETFASVSGGYGTPKDRTAPVVARNRYSDYMVTPGDPDNPQFKDSYYRLDHGPVTILTLDSTNGVPDEDTSTGMLSGEVFSGDDTNLTDDNLSTDTQGAFTAEQYDEAFANVYGSSESDLPNLGVDAEQWEWTKKQLADARAAGQVVLVQFHHAPYSNGVHGTPPNHEFADNQSGVAMRAYTPMFEKFGVAAVISGHDEMFERSFVDTDGDGVGLQVYDVGVAADGLRGEQLITGADGELKPLRFNSHSEWMASADEPELWELDQNGNPRLVDGGLHYGHLQMDLTRTECGSELTLSPVYLFPQMDSNYEVTGTERRVYDDVVELQLNADGEVVTENPCETTVVEPTEPAPTEPEPTEPEPTEPERAALTVDTSNTAAGDTVTVSGSSFEPGIEVALELRSTPVRVGSTTVTAEGTFSATVTIPADTQPGTHQIVAILADGSEVSIEIEVSSAVGGLIVTGENINGGTDADGDGLAQTGAASWVGIAALSALVLLTAGALLHRRARV